MPSVKTGPFLMFFATLRTFSRRSILIGHHFRKNKKLLICSKNSSTVHKRFLSWFIDQLIYKCESWYQKRKIYIPVHQSEINFQQAVKRLMFYIVFFLFCEKKWRQRRTGQSDGWRPAAWEYIYCEWLIRSKQRRGGSRFKQIWKTEFLREERTPKGKPRMPREGFEIKK